MTTTKNTKPEPVAVGAAWESPTGRYMMTVASYRWDDERGTWKYRIDREVLGRICDVFYAYHDTVAEAVAESGI